MFAFKYLIPSFILVVAASALAADPDLQGRSWQPKTPRGYKRVFGPIYGANNAPGGMGFSSLDSYNVATCAELCNTRGADPIGGDCKFFNIWEGVDGKDRTFTCTMYYLVTDASTADNYGQGTLKIVQSRGYERL